MLGLPLVVVLTCVLGAQGRAEGARKLYTVRSPHIDRERRAMEIIDLGNFLLTNSEDGRPKAMAPFYLKGVAPKHVSINDIFAGVMPFIFIVIFAMVLLYMFPAIGMWLPEKLYGSR